MHVNVVVCMYMCSRKANVSVCAYVCERKEKQSLQSDHFCLMKNGRLAFRDVAMCRILMSAHQTSSPILKMSGIGVSEAFYRSTTWVKQPMRERVIANLQTWHKEFCRRTSYSVTRRKASPWAKMFGCFQKDSQSQQIVQ